MDNEHCRITTSYTSCAILEVFQLSEDPAKIMYALGTNLYHPSRGQPAAFIMFSGLAKGGNASLLAKFITDTFVGIVPGTFHCHPYAVENPKTSNLINWWVWEIPHEHFKDWWREQRIKRIKAQ